MRVYCFLLTSRFVLTAVARHFLVSGRVSGSLARRRRLRRLVLLHGLDAYIHNADADIYHDTGTYVTPPLLPRTMGDCQLHRDRQRVHDIPNLCPGRAG